MDRIRFPTSPNQGKKFPFLSSQSIQILKYQDDFSTIHTKVRNSRSISSELGSGVKKTFRCRICGARLTKQNLSKHRVQCEQFQLDTVHRIKKSINIEDKTKNKSKYILPAISARTNHKQENEKKQQLMTQIIQEKYRKRVRDMYECRIQCPQCGRKFSEKAALRHFPICKQKKQEKKKIIHESRKKSAHNLQKSNRSILFKALPNLYRLTQIGI